MADHVLSEYDNKVDLGRCRKVSKRTGAATIKPAYALTGYGETDEQVILCVNTSMSHGFLGVADLMTVIGQDIDTVYTENIAIDVIISGKFWVYIKGSSGNIYKGDKIMVSSTAGLCTLRSKTAAATVIDTTQFVGTALNYLANSVDIQCLRVER